MTAQHEQTATGRHHREADTLMLDIVGTIGALNIVTGPDRDELEVEISPVGADIGDRTYNVVRARRVGATVVYAAMFPSVPAGEYVVWHEESSPAGTVSVRGGEVSEYRLD